MNLISKNFLVKEYVENQKTIRQIGQENGFGAGSVYNYLKYYGIPRRKAMTDATKKKISETNKGKTSPRKGAHLTEEAKRKISQANRGKYKNPSEYGGHKKIKNDGYIKVYCPDNPNCRSDGYILEHVLIMEQLIGRHLHKDEVVHHKNHIKTDNRIENLQLMTLKEHASLHMKERWDRKKGVKTY